MRLFVVFEGGEGSGKSTQARALARKLIRLDMPVVLTHEPGGTALGNRLRRWVKWGEHVTPQTELLFILAARSQVVAEVIRPALERECTVICDRYMYSTIAYQGYGRGMDLELLTRLNGLVTEGVVPDLVVYLDCGLEEGLKRKRGERDRFEREDRGFHSRVKNGYLRMAAADPERWFVVDASLPRGDVQSQIWERVLRLLR